MVEIPLDETAEWIGRIAISDGLLSLEEECVIREFAITYGMDSEDFIKELKSRADKIDTRACRINPNVLKGIEFEAFIVRALLKFSNIEVESVSADRKMGVIPRIDKRSMQPDIKIFHKLGKIRMSYWFECKYRTADEILYLKKEQINRYKSTQEESGCTVFIVWGQGGKPSCPKDLYIIPIDDYISERLSGNGVTAVNKSDIEDYRLSSFCEYESFMKNQILTI